MAAEKGNNYWEQRLKHGRDKKYDDAEDLISAACDYFNHVDNEPSVSIKIKRVSKSSGEEITDEETLHKQPYTVVSMCTHIGITQQTWFSYRKQELTDATKDILSVVALIDDIITDNKYKGAATGQFNSSIIARDLGLIDKQEQKVQIEGIDSWASKLEP